MQVTATTPLLNAAVSYNLGERLLRTTVFQVGSLNGRFEKFLVMIYKLFSQFSCSLNPLDEARANRTVDVLTRLGARLSFVTPRDTKASVQMMHFKAADLHEKLKQVGARWEKIQDNNASLIVIIPPENATDQWMALEKDLSKFRWNKRSVTIDAVPREVIVTCENAEHVVPHTQSPYLFLHANSASVSFMMLTRRIGFYLGCGQDACLFDPRGTWKSTGIASEAGYYNDITAVFDKVRQDYDLSRIWVSSACGGSGPSAHLKAKFHGSVNFIYENGFADLYKDYVVPQGWLVKNFASKFWSGLASKDIPDEHKPVETGFNANEMWKDLRPTSTGKIMIANPDNDQRISAEVSKRNVELAQKVNTQVKHITFHSTSNDPHFDRYYYHSESRAEALKFIFA